MKENSSKVKDDEEIKQLEKMFKWKNSTLISSLIF
jgi:hypothetical protein